MDNNNSVNSNSDSYDSSSNTYNDNINKLDNSDKYVRDSDDPSSSIYKYRSTLIIIALISAAGLLAMSMNQTEFFSISSSSSSLSSLSTWKSSFFKSRISLAKTGVIDYSDLSTKEKEELFSDFKKTYKKEYQTEHLEEKSFENFSKFLKTVDKRNKKEAKKGGSAIHGVTIFADLSDDDFASSHLGFRETDERRMLMRSLKDKHKHSSSSSHKPTKQPTHKPTYSPTSKKGTYKNWAEDGYTTSVRDQGYCGSCWAISAVEQMESDAIISGLLTNKESLSVQQVVSCDRNDYGCHGGNTEVAYTYIGKTGGLQLETTYPYTSYYDVTGHCKYSDAKAKISLHGYHTLDDEDAMQDYVLKNGPLSVCLAASSWSSYQSGVVSSCDKAVDHCVQVVGVNTEDDYWIIRNSWGTDWGNSGYIYLKTGQNTCFVTYDPTYTSVKTA